MVGLTGHAHGDIVYANPPPPPSCGPAGAWRVQGYFQQFYSANVCGDSQFLVTAINIAAHYAHDPFDLVISGRNMPCPSVRVAIGGTPVDPADVTCGGVDNFFTFKYDGTIHVHVHDIADGTYTVSVTLPDGEVSSPGTPPSTNQGVGSVHAPVGPQPLPLYPLLVEDQLKIHAFSPTLVEVPGGFTLTIAGDSLDPAAKVFLDNRQLSGVTYDPASKTLSAAGPAGLAPGLYTVVVENPDHTRALADQQLEVLVGPKLLDFSPRGVYGGSAVHLDIAAENVDPSATLLVNNHPVASAVDAQGTVHADLPVTGGFILGGPFSMASSASNPAAAADQLTTFAVTSTAGLEKGMTVLLLDGAREMVTVLAVGDATTLAAPINAMDTVSNLEVDALAEAIPAGTDVVVGGQHVTTVADAAVGETVLRVGSFTAATRYQVGTSVRPASPDITHFTAFTVNAHVAGAGLVMKAGWGSGSYTLAIVNLDGRSYTASVALRIQRIPSLSGISPNFVYGLNQFTLTVAGDTLDSTATISIDGGPALTTSMNADGAISALVAAGSLAAGSHEVRVTNADGSFGTFRSLVVDPYFEITDFTPTDGYVDTTNSITISGNSLNAYPIVLATIDGHSLLNLQLNSDGTISAVVPAGIPAGSFPIELVNSNGDTATSPRPFVIRPPPPRLVVHFAPDGDVLPQDLLPLELKNFVIDPATTTANADGHGHIEYFVDDSQTPVELYSSAPIDFSNLQSRLHLLRIHLVNNDGSALHPDDTQLVDFEVRSGSGAITSSFQPPDPVIVTAVRVGQLASVGERLPLGGQAQYRTGLDYPFGGGNLCSAGSTLCLGFGGDLQGRFGLTTNVPNQAGDYVLAGRQLFAAFDINGPFQHQDMLSITAPTDVLIGTTVTIRAKLTNSLGTAPVIGRRVFLRIGPTLLLESYTDQNGVAAFSFAPHDGFRTTDYRLVFNYYGDYWWVPAFDDQNVVTVHYPDQPLVHVAGWSIDENTPIQVTGDGWPNPAGLQLPGGSGAGTAVTVFTITTAPLPNVSAGAQFTLISATSDHQTFTVAKSADAGATSLTGFVAGSFDASKFPAGSLVLFGTDLVALTAPVDFSTQTNELAVTPVPSAWGADAVVVGFGTATTELRYLNFFGAAKGDTTLNLSTCLSCARAFAAGALVVLSGQHSVAITGAPAGAHPATLFQPGIEASPIVIHAGVGMSFVDPSGHVARVTLLQETQIGDNALSVVTDTPSAAFGPGSRVAWSANPTTLTAAISSGSTLASLQVAPLPMAIAAGTDLTIGFDSGTTMDVATSADAPAGATTLSINSAIASASFGSGAAVVPAYLVTLHLACSDCGLAAFDVKIAPDADGLIGRSIAAQSVAAADGSWNLSADDGAGRHFDVDFRVAPPAPVTASLVTALTTGGLAIHQLQLSSLPVALPAGTVLTLGFGTANTQNVLVTAALTATNQPVSVTVENFSPASAFAAGSSVLVNNPLVAIIDHYGVDAFGADSTTIVFTPGQVRDIHLAGHGRGPAGVGRTYTWFMDKGTADSRVLSPQSFADAGYAPGNGNLFDVTLSPNPPIGFHTLSLQVCAAGTNLCASAAVVVKIVLEPVILIHGYLSSPDQMSAVASDLKSMGTPYYSLDLRRSLGSADISQLFGATDMVNGAYKDLYQYAQSQAQQAQDALNIDHTFQVGDFTGSSAISVPLPFGALINPIVAHVASAVFNGLIHGNLQGNPPELQVFEFKASDLPAPYGDLFQPDENSYSTKHKLPIFASIALILIDPQFDVSSDQQSLTFGFKIGIKIKLKFYLTQWLEQVAEPAFRALMGEGLNHMNFSFSSALANVDVRWSVDPKADLSKGENPIRVHAVIDFPWLSWLGSVANQSVTSYLGSLDDLIHQVQKDTGSPKVAIVGMDMGGLLGRWYAQYGPTDSPPTSTHTGWVNRSIDKLIIVGAPNHGSDAAKLFPDLAHAIIDIVGTIIEIAGAALSEFGGAVLAYIGHEFITVLNALLDLYLGPAINDFKPHSQFLQTLNGNNSDADSDDDNPVDKVPDHVQVFNFYSNSSWLTVYHRHCTASLTSFLGCALTAGLPYWITSGDFYIDTDKARIYNPSIINMEFDGGAHWNLLDAGQPIVGAIHEALVSPVFGQTPVVDDVAPTLVAPAPIVLVATQANGVPRTDPAIVGFLNAATATDNVDANPLLTNDAPAVFPNGVTTVTWTATDYSGNSSTAHSTVTVSGASTTISVTPPAPLVAEATSPGGSPKTNSDIAAWLLRATADDTAGVATIVNDAPAVLPLGTTMVTWTASDLGGHTASAFQTVTVRDTTPPLLTIPPATGVEALSAVGDPATTPGVHAFLYGATAVDAVDTSPVVTWAECVGPQPTPCTALAQPANFAIGIHTIEFSAADFTGNISVRVTYLVILDTTPPVVTAPAPITVESDVTGGAGASNPAIASFLAAGPALDNIDGPLSVTAIAPTRWASPRSTSRPSTPTATWGPRARPSTWSTPPRRRSSSPSRRPTPTWPGSSTSRAPRAT